MTGLRIDPPTVAVFSVFIALIMAGSMLSMFATRKTFPGFGLWTAAAVLNVLGQVLFGIQPLLPAWLGVVLANTLLILCFQWILRGLWRFGGKERSIAVDLGVAAFTAATLAVLSYAYPSLSLRILVFSAVNVAQAIASLATAISFSRKKDEGINAALGAGFLMIALIGAARIAFTFAVAESGPVLAMQSAFQAIWLILYAGADVLIFLGVQNQNAQRAVEELRKSAEEVKTLSGIIPICSNCKKVRNDKGYWEQVEAYVARHSEAGFSHGICPECLEKLYPEAAARIKAKKAKADERNS